MRGPLVAMADPAAAAAAVAAAAPSCFAVASANLSSKVGSPVVAVPRLAGYSQFVRAAVSTPRQPCRKFTSAATCSRFGWENSRSKNFSSSSLDGRQLRVFASKEEVPSEILEDSKFVPLTDDDPRFGPPALLLLGFKNDEGVKVQNLLKDMEGDFMQVLLCTKEMARGTLGKAVSVMQPNLLEVEVAEGLPRISFISGLTGEEIMMLIQVFPEAGLEASVFAAHVPLNSEKSLTELMEEIMDDHRRLDPNFCCPLPYFQNPRKDSLS